MSGRVPTVEIAERMCPECGARIPVLAGYPDWCDACGWNLKPPPRLDPAGGRFAEFAAALGRRSGRRLARNLLAAKDLEPRWTPGRIAAYGVAIAFHLFTAALIAAGIAAIVMDFPNALAILLGAAMLGVGVMMRPRVDKLDEQVGHRLDPATAPTLHEIVSEVAAALDRRPPDAIRIDAEWNASWRVIGLRRRRVLTLGLPLLVALDPPERVALIAHEIGHDRNGDARRGLIVGSAVEGLNWLSRALQPGAAAETGELAVAGWGPVEPIARAVMWLVARPVDAVLWIEARLLLRDMQRAEYLADALAARVAGSTATITLEERLLLWSAFELVVQQAAHADATDVLDRLRLSLQLVPGRERERRRRAARLEDTRLLATHPPSGMRIELLESRTAREPRVVLNQARSRRIDAELEPLATRIGHELLDAYRASLYR
jgi:Zn-dependent protease with chaperone function